MRAIIFLTVLFSLSAIHTFADSTNNKTKEDLRKKECAENYRSNYFREKCFNELTGDGKTKTETDTDTEPNQDFRIKFAKSSTDSDTKTYTKYYEDPKWNIRRSSSDMDDSKTIIVWLEADNTITGWPDKKVVPKLIIRCEENKTELFIKVQMPPQPEVGNYNKATVRLRFDEGKPFKQNWSESTDSKSLFAPKAIALSRQINKSEKMLFEFIPYNSNTQLVEFDVRGAKEFLSELAKTCNWKI